MEIRKVGSRGVLFTFYDLGIPTNIYAIDAKHHIFIIDTYLGPEIMEEVDLYIRDAFGQKPMLVVNTHSHWDHVWGNGYYSDVLILSHEKCRIYMKQEGSVELEKHSEYRRGDVILTYPNIAITDKVHFYEDDIVIYYTPGHTDDSISVWDMKDKVLFAGDNLEKPIPYIECLNLGQYVKTLEAYLRVDADAVIGGHTHLEDKSLVEANLHYIKKVLTGEAIEVKSEVFQEYHKANMAWLATHGE